MNAYPALMISFAIYSIYVTIGLIPLVSILFVPPKSRAVYIFFGVFMMFFAAHILTIFNGAHSIADSLIDEINGESITDSDKKIAAIKEFIHYTNFIAYFISFLFGGVGVNAFSKAIPSIENSRNSSINLKIIFQEFQFENKSTKRSILIAAALIVIGILLRSAF